MSAYKLLKQGVRRLADNANIPPDAGNIDWQQYQVWLGLGNTPDPQDPDPIPDPRIVLDEQEAAAAKIDTNVQTFLNMNPVQLSSWITNNVSGPGLTLAQVKTGLDTALNVLGRIAQNAGRGRSIR